MSMNNCKLNSLKDWEQWNQQFTLTVIAADLWEMIEGVKAPKWKPVESEISFYSCSTQTSTQSHSSQSQTVSEDSVDFTELSTESQKIYISVITLYKNKLKAYNNQQLVIQKLIDFIIQTVSSSYLKSCCNLKEKINVWYINLQKLAETFIIQEYDQVRDWYNKALQFLTKIKNHKKWITEWEMIIHFT